MLLTVVVMFFIFWTPRMCYVVVIGFFKEHIPSNYRTVHTRLQAWVFLNSCINFFVYAANSKYAFVISSLKTLIMFFWGGNDLLLDKGVSLSHYGRWNIVFAKICVNTKIQWIEAPWVLNYYTIVGVLSLVFAKGLFPINL